MKEKQSGITLIALKKVGTHTEKLRLGVCTKKYNGFTVDQFRGIIIRQWRIPLYVA